MFKLLKLKEIQNIENQTEENCFFVIIKTKGEYIKYIDSSNLNKDLVRLAIRLNGLNIRYIPEEFIDEELMELAAIHGATRNVLNTDNEDILNISEFIQKYSEEDIKKARQATSGYNYGNYHYGYGNLFINGEWTNFENKFSFYLIEDVPRFIKYYSDNGFEIPSKPGGSIYFKNGNMWSLNSLVESKNKLDFTPDAGEFLTSRGKINSSYVKKSLKIDPSLYWNIPEDKRSYILASISIYYLCKKDDISNSYPDISQEKVKKNISEIIKIVNSLKGKELYKLLSNHRLFYVFNNLEPHLYKREKLVEACYYIIKNKENVYTDGVYKCIGEQFTIERDTTYNYLIECMENEEFAELFASHLVDYLNNAASFCRESMISEYSSWVSNIKNIKAKEIYERENKKLKID